mmetsp:Transcript_28351/g.59879  ORF Transcript_28351/g.59879 Transcript_28351/m.59879 type:complete len:334 (-) Transcript_28351:322-1323(-)
MSLLKKFSSKKNVLVKVSDDQTYDADKNNTFSSSDHEDNVETTEVFSYRMSCKCCGKERANIRFKSETERKVAEAVTDHYKELWRELKKHRNDHSDGGLSDLSETGNLFCNSSLMYHLMEHCLDMKSRKEVVAWCQNNVSVQVKSHKYETRKTDGTFNFNQQKERKFVRKQQEKERSWERKNKREEHKKEQQLQLARTADLNKGTFDIIWNERYKELVAYAEEHEGDTKVPAEYGPNLRLGRWVENQRIQYRRKHNGKDQNPALTDLKEGLLEEIGFVWSLQPKSRNDDRGIAVMYGYDIGDFDADPRKDAKAGPIGDSNSHSVDDSYRGLEP